MFSIRTKQNRTQDYSVVLKEADCVTAIVLTEDDIVRMKIGSNGEAPILDLSSEDETANGSSIEFIAGSGANRGTCTIRLAQGDVAELCGAYDCELLVIDNSESAPPNAAKHVEDGVLFVHPSQTGEIVEQSSASSSS